MKRWLWSESHGFRLFAIITIAAVVNLFALILSTTALSWNKVEIPPIPNGPENLAVLPWPMILVMLYLWVYGEEIIFRVPLGLIAPHVQLPITLTAAVTSSVLFGYLHGGISHIAIQGISGFIYSIIFLKCGGMKGKRLKPLLASTSAHFLGNVLIMGRHFI